MAYLTPTDYICLHNLFDDSIAQYSHDGCSIYTRPGPTLVITDDIEGTKKELARYPNTTFVYRTCFCHDEIKELNDKGFKRILAFNHYLTNVSYKELMTALGNTPTVNFDMICGRVITLMVFTIDKGQIDSAGGKVYHGLLDKIWFKFDWYKLICSYNIRYWLGCPRRPKKSKI